MPKRLDTRSVLVIGSVVPHGLSLIVRSKRSEISWIANDLEWLRTYLWRLKTPYPPCLA